MALQSLLDTSSLRSLQILGGADSLLTDPTDAALHSGDGVLPSTLLGSLPLSGLGDAADLPAVDGLSSVAPIVGTVEGVLSGAASTGGLNAGLLGPLNGVTGALGSLGTQGLEGLANNAILDLHATLEGASDVGGLPYTIHGITNLGETIGLGKIGGANLLTDVLDAPTAALAGNLTPIENLPHDLSAVVTATQGIVSGIETDLASGALLSDPVGHLTAAVSQLTTLPLTNLANDAIGTIHGTLEGALDPLLPGTIHGVTGFGNAIGLGELGGSNLLTDATHLPTSVLSGDLSSVTHLPGDVGQVVGAVGSALGGIGSDLGGGLLDGVTHPTTGGGILGGALPGQGVADGVVGQVEGVVNGAGDGTGLGGLTHAATGALDGITGGPNSPIGDLLHAPTSVLGGASGGAQPLPGDGGATLGSLGSVVSAVAHEVTGLGGTSGGLLGGLGGATGGAGGLAGTATGLLGGINGGSGSGSHDLITIAAGPQTPTSGLGIDVLSSGNGQTHLIDTHAGSANAPVPTIATLGLLSGDSLHLPALGGGGGDALSGALAPVTGAGAPTSGGADAHAGIDLGVAHIDLPIAAAHADPFAALGVGAHHA